MPSADENRQNTARERRRLIIQTVERHLGNSGAPALDELGRRLGREQWVVTGADIDSLISTALLCAASEGRWRIGAVNIRSRDVRVAPSLGRLRDAVQRDDVYGVDLFSFLMPSISNHPLLFGTTSRQPRRADVRAECAEFDLDVMQAMSKQNAINLSGWAQIAANFGSEHPQSRYYKYPLGTAQLALACMEVLDVAPRLYDRQYLPWMIANCDGGLKTIRQYPWNVEAWWSALAAVAGPASLSEAIYRVATEQRPTEFIDVDRRLRYDEPDRAKSLRSDWNIAGESLDHLLTASALVRDLSGWPDPFGDDADVASWAKEETTGNLLTLRRAAATRTRVGAPGLGAIQMDDLRTHLNSARAAVHMNFSEFRERGVSLGWLLPHYDASVEERLGPSPELDLVAANEETDDETAMPVDDDDDEPGQAVLI